MRGEDLLEKSFKEALQKVSVDKKLNIPDEIINYISQIMSLYYRGIPLYLIDISEKTPFRRYKIRGDVSLLLVGLFTEWVSRRNRPLTERDYIEAGKINYYNAYMYLNLNYSDLFKENFRDISVFFSDMTDLITGHMEIFKNISENFERYAFFLREYRAENIETGRIFDLFNDIRERQLKRLIEEL
ncbi:MAG: hypothetical protein Q9M89_02455 [Persephonella sp.]|nr:hypothetical protein [Persephonella sp.]